MCGILVAGGAPSSADETSHAVIHPAEWDFGYLPQNSEVSHRFYVCNTGPSPLRVTKIKAGCSCTSVSKIDHPISPGDSAAIAVTLKSGRYHHSVAKTTEVHTDDPGTPILELKIRAYIVKKEEPCGEVAVTPHKLTWRADRGVLAVAADTVAITNTGTDSLQVIIRHPPETTIADITTPPHLAPGETSALVFHAAASAPFEEFAGLSATLAFIGRDSTIVTIPIEIKE